MPHIGNEKDWEGLLEFYLTSPDFVPTLSFAMPARYESSNKTQPARISRWWTQLRSAELDRLVALADIDNLDIAVAVAQLEAAQAQADIAEAVLWPTLSYVDNNTRSRGSGTGTPGRIVSASSAIPSPNS